MKLLLMFLIGLLMLACSSEDTKKDIAFESLTLNETHVNLTVEESYILNYHVKPEEYELSNLTIQLDDTAILHLEDETITALKPGESIVELYYNETLVAQLNVNVHPILHEVSFINANIDSLMIADGTRLPHNDTIPNQEGYTFLGWFYDVQLTKPFLYQTAIKEDLTLYAHWLEKDLSYNLTNDFQDGPYKPENFPDYIIIDADPDKGFNFPYIIFIPSTLYEYDNIGYKRYLLVEGFNAVYTNDIDPDFNRLARDRQHFYGYMVQEELFIPRVMPILPEMALFDTSLFTTDLEVLKTINPHDYYDYLEGDLLHFDTLFGYGYHTLRLEEYIDDLLPREWDYEEGFSELIFDLITPELLSLYIYLPSQYLAMINDAQRRLNDAGWNLEEEIFLHGFSASGFFANRFTMTYPDHIQAVFSGAFYYPVIPTKQYNDHLLDFPLGVNEYQAIFGHPFNLEAYQNVPKLYYIGMNDDLDPLNDSDATGDIVSGYHINQQDIAFDIFGEGDFFDRFNSIVEIYYETGGNAVYIVDSITEHRLLQHHHRMIVQFFKINRNQQGFMDYSFDESTVEYIIPENRD